MPLKLYEHGSHDYFINAKRNHLMLADSLGEGQSCTVSSADQRTVKLSPDGTPRKAPNGSVSIASGKVLIAHLPAAPGVPIVLTSHISELRGAHAKDANGAIIPDAVDAVVFVPRPGVAEGDLFGVPAAT